MRPRRQAGLSRFEGLLVLLVAAALVWQLLQQLAHYQTLARSTVMEMTVVNMRSGLRLRVAELMMSNRSEEMTGLLNQNPITWLDAPPSNYLGQLKQPDRAALPPDSWYFDEELHELIYLFPKNNIEWTVQNKVESVPKALHVKTVGRKTLLMKETKMNTEGVTLELRYEK